MRWVAQTQHQHNQNCVEFIIHGLIAFNTRALYSFWKPTNKSFMLIHWAILHSYTKFIVTSFYPNLSQRKIMKSNHIKFVISARIRGQYFRISGSNFQRPPRRFHVSVYALQNGRLPRSSERKFQLETVCQRNICPRGGMVLQNFGCSRSW